jgi:polysaccharide chain length determinant protein (PEP-CTERM system associated)
MAETANTIKVDQIIAIILRRRWILIIPFCIAIVVGSYLAITLPKIYSASTLIFIQPQRVPQNYVRSIVSSDIASRINTISQRVMSRTNLEKIIKKFNLFSGPENQGMFMEDKLALLKKRISVDVTRSSRRGVESFSISFRGKDPDKVMRVANTLAAYVIDENLKLREAQAVGTSDFLAGELNSTRAKLIKQENALKEYREQYMGGLPEQLDSNLRILERLQEQLDSANTNLRDVKNRLANLETTRSQPVVMQPAGTDAARGTGTVTNLAQMQMQLSDLKTRYTDKHPDVLRLQKMIEEMEAGKVSGEETGETDVPASGRNININYANLNRINELNSEKAELLSEIEKLNKQISIYQKRVEDTPKREQELLSLTRDYENIRDTYNSILERKLEAELSVNMEKKQKGEQFRIIDPARLPQKPVSPDMKKLFLFTIAAGLGAGGGIAFLLEFFNQGFKSIKDIESYLDVPVLAAIPTVLHKKDKLLRVLNNAAFAFSLMISFVLLAGFALLTLKGVDDALELLKKFI